MTQIGYDVITGGAKRDPNRDLSRGIRAQRPGECPGDTNPKNGSPCGTVLFPFIGHRDFGCDGTLDREGNPVVFESCRPVILKPVDFFDHNTILRYVITAAIAWLIWRNL